MKQHCKKWWVWVTLKRAKSEHEVTVKHSRCLKVQTGWVKQKRFNQKLQKYWGQNTLTFKNIHLSGSLHKHELSINLQHAFVWGGRAQLGPTPEQVHRWPCLVKLGDGKANLRGPVWLGLNLHGQQCWSTIAIDTFWTVHKGVECHFHSVMLENTQ